MATQMTQPPLKLVEASHPKAQRIALLRAPHQLELAYAEIPDPGPTEIRLKIRYVGLCGSDVEAFRGERAPEFLSTPTRLGHEVAGVIDAVGAEVVGLRVGDAVTCRYVWGAFAEYIVCKPFNVKVVPPHFPLQETSMLEVLPGVIHAAELAEISPRSSILITGQGVSGLIMTQIAHLFSPRVLAVTDLHRRNLDLARSYGATHTYQAPTPETRSCDLVKEEFPDGFDVVIPCLLSGEGMIDAVEAVGMGGKIVMYGCIGVCHEPFDFFKVHRKRINIYSTEPRSDLAMRRYFEEGVRLAVDGLVRSKEMITHLFPLERIQEAFELRTNKQADALHILIDLEAREEASS
jgi:threonine dehydrogenase-like Zn-dependent dehydrogenase